ncbi:MAG: 50S ribosomal protein L4 [Candidatus Omnitrophica bacterium]|nr:50S ribosomal protein L4 [Candidatus Omnitrophota bacterium]MBI5143591.1 50S ribosomal protein L4 [Candidatus Omnitrophota bacterium]
MSPKTKDKKPKAASIPIFNAKGKEVERYELNKDLFTGEVDKKVLYQVTLMYNANQRRGTASTKTRSDVSGGGKKPWRQKGTGRARAGSTRSPLWRGGGKVFGPHPRDFHYDLPKKIKRLALLSSLNSKLIEERLLGIDAIAIDEPKTKKFKSIMDALKLKGNSLFILDEIDGKIRRASRNLQETLVRNYKDFNTMDVLAHDNVVMTKAALEKLPERFKE